MKPRIEKVLKLVLIGIVGVTAVGFIVMGLWNWLAPAVFGWRAITFWQALGMFLLIKILFGEFRGGPGRHGGWRRRMRDRWEAMTPEEREKLRQEMGGS